MSKWSALPVSMPNGSLLPHMSARARTQMIDALFMGAGGFDRALAWVNASDDNYGEFLRMWARGSARAVSKELSVGEGVEGMLDRLEKLDEARMVDVTPRDITDVEDDA